MVDTQAIAGRLITDLMRDYGITRDQAAGVAGNFAHETLGFTRMEETGAGKGLGYGMWTGARRTAFEDYAKENDLDIGSYDANYGYLRHELATDRYERRQFMRVTTAKTPEEAARIVSENFLRPGTPHLERRIDYATQFAGAVPAEPRIAPTPATPSMPLQSVRMGQTARNPSLQEALDAKLNAPAMPRPRPPHTSDGNQAVTAIDAVAPGRPIAPSAFGYAPPAGSAAQMVTGGQAAPDIAMAETVKNAAGLRPVPASQIERAPRPVQPNVPNLGDALALAPVQGGRQTAAPFDAIYDTRSEAMRMLAQPETVSSQGIGLGASVAPVAMPRPRPPTSAPNIQRSQQKARLPDIPPSTIGQPPGTRVVQSVSMPPLRHEEVAAAPRSSSPPRVTVSTPYTTPQSTIERIGTRPLQSTPRPVAPSVASGPSNLQVARNEQSEQRRLSQPASRPARTTYQGPFAPSRPVQPSIPGPNGFTVADKPQDRLIPDIANNSPANFGPVIGAARFAPTPRPTVARATLPAPPYRSVATELDVQRPAMPAMPRPRPEMGMGGVDIIPVVPNTPVTPMPRLDRPGIFGKPQIFGHDIKLPGALGVIQDVTKRMANSSGPFNNGADNLIYNTLRGGDFNTPGAATAQAGGYLYAPRPGGGYINVGRVDQRMSGAETYARLNARNNPTDRFSRGREISQSGGPRSLMD